MDRPESFIDSIDDGVLSPQPFLTPVTGNDCCKGVWVIGTKEWEAALLFYLKANNCQEVGSAKQG